MPSGTTYKPTRVADFEAAKLNYNAQGVSTTITAGTTGNLDYTLSDDCLITGAWMLSDGGQFGDTASFQVVDTAGILAPAGTVLNTFITNWIIPPNVDEQFEMAYPANVYAGLTLRLVYTSTGSTNVPLAVNYKLHKVLV
jgi:hypothetical protein